MRGSYPAPAKVLTFDSPYRCAVGRCNCLRKKVIELRYLGASRSNYLPITSLAIVANCMLDVPS
jgi:hypothetical protein